MTDDTAQQVLPTLPGVLGEVAPELFTDRGREVLPLLGPRCERRQGCTPPLAEWVRFRQQPSLHPSSFTQESCITTIYPIPRLTLALAHVIVSHRTSQQYSSRAPFHSILSARLILGDVLPIRSIIFCAWMPGRKVDGMISAFLSDTLITIERFSTLETLGSICKEHL